MNRIAHAMQAIQRADFLPKGVHMRARHDVPLPIGYGQTNSQPSTVARMLTWLDVRPGDRVMEVGSGSGWVAALLGFLVGQDGHVFAVDRIPELVRRGRRNCQRVNMMNVSFFVATTRLGLADKAPFDRILVSAAAKELPMELVGQLVAGGKLVIPVGYAILEITKRSSDELDIVRHEGFIFVPLLSS